MYQRLKDAAVATGDERYDGRKAIIWYAKPGASREFRMGYDWIAQRKDLHGYDLPDKENISQTHAVVGGVNETDLGKIFKMMQGHIWSPNGEAARMIRRQGLAHTSMSVGDVVQIGDKFHMVDRRGFERLENGPTYSSASNINEEMEAVADLAMEIAGFNNKPRRKQ